MGDLSVKDTRISDLLAAIGTLILGIGAFVLSSSLPTAKIGLGSGGFPRVIGFCLILLGAIQMVFTCMKGFRNVQVQLDWATIRPIAATAAIAFLYVGLLRQAGFLLLTPLLLFSVMMLFGYRKYLSAAIISIVTSVVIYVLFSKVFMIFLPECRWF